MILGQASRGDSICVEGTTETRKRQHPGSHWGSLRCSHWERCVRPEVPPVLFGKVAGILSCRPSKCRESVPDPSRKSGCHSFISSNVLGVLCLRHPALVFIFHTCHWFYIVTADPLIPSLLSLRFVLGEIQCLTAQLFQATVRFFVCHSSLGCTTKVVELLGSNFNGVDSLQQTPIIQHIYLH